MEKPHEIIWKARLQAALKFILENRDRKILEKIKRIIQEWEKEYWKILKKVKDIKSVTLADIRSIRLENNSLLIPASGAMVPSHDGRYLHGLYLLFSGESCKLTEGSYSIEVLKETKKKLESLLRFLRHLIYDLKEEDQIMKNLGGMFRKGLEYLLKEEKEIKREERRLEHHR